MKQCAYCGRNNEDAAIRCRECGTNFEASHLDDAASIGLGSRIAKFAAGTTKKQRLIMLCSGIILAVTAVWIGTDHTPSPQLSEVEVAQIANATAETEGIRLSEYENPHVDFKFANRSGTWTVIYSLKLPTPWGTPLPTPQSAHGAPRHFFVEIDDTTKHPQFGLLVAVGDPLPTKPPPGITILGHVTNQGWSDSNR
jgi:hypothetical protein